MEEQKEEVKEEKLLYRLIIDGEMKDFNNLDKCLGCIKQRKEKLYYCSIRVTKMINIIEEESSSKIKEGDEEE